MNKTDSSDQVAAEMILSGIFVYPIKSLKGIKLTESKIENRGLQYDRRWMLVDSANRFISQREHPRLATVSVSLEPKGLKIGTGEADALFVPYDGNGSNQLTVQIWNDVCSGVSVSDESDRWFSDLLGVPCRLVHMPDETKRPVDPEYAFNADAVSFADGYPFLLTTEASLADLNARLAYAVAMDRFRPNFVVRGATAFGEDGWRSIAIGPTLFHVVKPCARCVTTTIDQSLGVRDGDEPLKTLATFRRKNNDVLFGQNLTAASEGGVVQLGDRIQVVATV